MRIGIFGGTFDPPHLGHLILASESQAQLKLDRILFVLTAHPPHKQGREITDLDERLDMLSAALQDNPEFKLSRVEIDRPGPHYALDTMLILREDFSSDELIYLMGADSLDTIAAWHQPQAFLAACDSLGVVRRPGTRLDLQRLEKEVPGLSNKVQFVDAPLLEISAQQIRKRVKSGASVRYYLPPGVIQIIKEREIYQE